MERENILKLELLKNNEDIWSNRLRNIHDYWACVEWEDDPGPSFEQFIIHLDLAIYYYEEYLFGN